MLCVSELKAPNYWTPDTEAVACFVCRRKFSVMNRKHHCRKCGSVVCDGCSKTRVTVPEHGMIEPVRVCDECMHQRPDGSQFGVDEVMDGIRALQHSRASTERSEADTVYHNGSHSSTSGSYSMSSGSAMVVQSLPSLGEAQANGLSISLLCDGCDRELGVVQTVRYWCADCKDFELCDDCFGVVEHPHLRFVKWDGRAKGSGFSCGLRNGNNNNNNKNSNSPQVLSDVSKTSVEGDKTESGGGGLMSKLSCRSMRKQSDDGNSRRCGGGVKLSKPRMCGGGGSDDATNDDDDDANNNNDSNDKSWRSRVCGGGGGKQQQQTSSDSSSYSYTRSCSIRRAPWEEGTAQQNQRSCAPQFSAPSMPSCRGSRKTTEAVPMDDWDDSPSRRTWKPTSDSNEGGIKARLGCKTSNSSGNGSKSERGRCSTSRGDDGGSTASTVASMLKPNCMKGRV